MILCANSPVSFFDPSGQDKQKKCKRKTQADQGEEPSNKPYKNSKEANSQDRKQGYSDAHELKKDYVGEKSMNKLPRVIVCFGITGKELNINELTETLDIIPTHTRGIDDWPEIIKKI